MSTRLHHRGRRMRIFLATARFFVVRFSPHRDACTGALYDRSSSHIRLTSLASSRVDRRRSQGPATPRSSMRFAPFRYSNVDAHPARRDGGAAILSHDSDVSESLPYVRIPDGALLGGSAKDSHPDTVAPEISIGFFGPPARTTYTTVYSSIHLYTEK